MSRETTAPTPRQMHDWIFAGLICEGVQEDPERWLKRDKSNGDAESEKEEEVRACVLGVMFIGMSGGVEEALSAFAAIKEEALQRPRTTFELLADSLNLPRELAGQISDAHQKNGVPARVIAKRLADGEPLTA